jgi:thiol-disulfide isomerase/thioredoxin
VTIEQLRGKVVILDFWTYGCVNCMHVLRDLKTLEQRFPTSSPCRRALGKVRNEKSTDNLRRILIRYEIEHPVANDANLEIWRRYGAQAWPTRIIIDPAGNLVGTAMGEGNLEGFVNAIRTVVRIFDERGEINRSPLPLQLERQSHEDQPLLYPGKLLADEQSNRLFIADSNHNRIVVSTLDGSCSR